jgi:hypothetical protein
MADVYKFRVTIDLEIATHDNPKDVRDFLRTFTAEALRLEQEKPRGEVVEHIIQFDVRAKRLDDWATIGPDVALRIAAISCPHCGRPYADVVINRLPFTCPLCHKVIPVEGTVTP